MINVVETGNLFRALLCSFACVIYASIKERDQSRTAREKPNKSRFFGVEI